MADAVSQIKVRCPDAGVQELIEINLDQSMFSYQSNHELWRDLSLMITQESFYSLSKGVSVHPKFSFRDEKDGQYKQPVFEISGRQSALNWQAFVREVTPEVAEALHRQSQDAKPGDGRLPVKRFK